MTIESSDDRRGGEESLVQVASSRHGGLYLDQVVPESLLDFLPGDVPRDTTQIASHFTARLGCQSLENIGNCMLCCMERCI